MARADLLMSLIKHGFTGNKAMFTKVVEAVIAEERNKNHTVLAKQLDELIGMQSVTEPNNISRVILDSRIENFVQEIIPERRIHDLILPKEIIETCLDIVQEQHRTDLLRSYNLEPRNRFLFIGPPGNGKTSLAEAIAESLMVPLFIVRYDTIIGTYLGETASRLRKLFDFIKTRKCVLFFDEFETLGKERGDTHETGEIKRVVSSLLMQIDSLPSHVVLIGATNHPELLDRAVWRRFNARINLPMPTRSRIEEWFILFEKKHNIKFGYAPSTFGKKLVGLNFAEIEDFGITILRKFVLSQPSSDIKGIVNKELQNLKTRNIKVEPNNKYF
jgi:SpoVK/Ycf46/Vps4 family AAA+-type ATPase